MNREEALNWCVKNLAEWPNDLSSAAPAGWEWKHIMSLTPVLKALEGFYEYIEVNDYLHAPTEFKYTTIILITPKQQDSIDIIMDSFNFRKVDKVMRKLKWTWALEGDVHNDTKTPTEAAIRRAARRILKSAIHRGSADSGGLLAEYDEDGEELILKFVLEEWWSDGEE